MKIHHIGYFVDDIEAASAEFNKLGFSRKGDAKDDASRDISIQFLEHADGYVVELIQPTSENSSYYGLRKRYRNSPYHICYETDDMTGEIEKMTAPEGGYTLIQQPHPALAISGSPNVAFLMNRHIGMIELISQTTE